MSNELVFLTDRPLSQKALDLVRFDMDSIRQAAAGRRAEAPNLWLADPEEYEHNGRVLRDSTSPRLLAYSPEDKTLYANDGCNSCIHQLAVNLAVARKDELLTIASANKIRPELVGRMAELAAAHRL
jgi:hypothetical protein